ASPSASRLTLRRWSMTLVHWPAALSVLRCSWGLTLQLILVDAGWIDRLFSARSGLAEATEGKVSASGGGARAKRQAKRAPPECQAEALLSQRRIVGRVHVDRLDALDQLAVLLGGGLDALPLGVGAEGFPAPGGRRVVGEGEDIDQLPLGLFGVGRGPETDNGHAVLLEQLAGVLFKTGLECIHLARSGVIGPQLEHERG